MNSGKKMKVDRIAEILFHGSKSEWSASEGNEDKTDM
jgi:hypothetical protein